MSEVLFNCAKLFISNLFIHPNIQHYQKMEITPAIVALLLCFFQIVASEDVDIAKEGLEYTNDVHNIKSK